MNFADSLIRFGVMLSIISLAYLAGFNQGFNRGYDVATNPPRYGVAQ